MIIKPPFSLWIQISSLSFFLAGNYSDLLIIRLCLTSAYIFLFANSLLGAPIWPRLRVPGHIQADGIFWAILNLYVHLSTVVRLFLDERPVALKNEELWRLFYRTGGLSKKLFQDTIDPYCDVVTYNKDDEIPIDDEYNSRQWFYIIYQGQVELKVVALSEEIEETDWKMKRIKRILSSTTRIAESGQLFDFRSLGFLKDSVIAQRQQHRHKLHSAKAMGHVVLFRFPAKLMATKIACHPTTRLMWKELLMENLLRIVQRHFYKTRRERIESKLPTGFTINERVSANTANTAINPIFWPLEKWEEPDPLRAGSGLAFYHKLRHVIKSMHWSFTPPWPFKGFPAGLRHTQQLRPPILDFSPTTAKGDASVAASSEEDDLECQSLLTNGGASLGYSSVETFSQEDDFLEYLNEMDEATGLGLNISFLAAAHSCSDVDEEEQ